MLQHSPGSELSVLQHAASIETKGVHRQAHLRCSQLHMQESGMSSHQQTVCPLNPRQTCAASQSYLSCMIATWFNLQTVFVLFRCT